MRWGNWAENGVVQYKLWSSEYCWHDKLAVLEGGEQGSKSLSSLPFEPISPSSLNVYLTFSPSSLLFPLFLPPPNFFWAIFPAFLFSYSPLVLGSLVPRAFLRRGEGGWNRFWYRLITWPFNAQKGWPFQYINNNNNNNNNDLLTDPLGASSLLNYINYNYKINQITLFANLLDTEFTEINYSKINKSFCTLLLKKFLRVLKRFCNLYSFQYFLVDY